MENNVLPNNIHHCHGFNFYKISEIWRAFHIIGQQQQRPRAIVCRPLRGKRSAILKMKQAQREAQSLHENPMCNNFHQILSVNKKFRISGQIFTKENLSNAGHIAGLENSQRNFNFPYIDVIYLQDRVNICEKMYTLDKSSPLLVLKYIFCVMK